MKKKISRLLSSMLAVVLITSVVVPVSAATISELQEQQKEHQSKLEEVTGQITEMENEQEILEEEISDLDAEIINMFTSIELLEDEISEKEDSISEVEADIAVAQADYEKAKQEEESQYEAMKIRIRYMYEQGDTAYLQLFLEASNFSDMLNKADYIEQLYEYDRKMLLEYQAVKEEVAALKQKLETDMTLLESNKADLESQQKELDILLEEKKRQSENYESQIAKAKQQAAYYKTKIQQEEAELKKLQEAERRKANSGNYTVSQFDTSVIDDSPGSELGKNIAKYACQYIGNPYVPGGTSLTEGADCSGFTYRVYKDFGYTLPRTSFQQRGAGKSVNYEDAQPGDIICYDGHVGIYVGGGYIVHASTQKTGIKISRATYRSILSVRRII